MVRPMARGRKARCNVGYSTALVQIKPVVSRWKFGFRLTASAGMMLLFCAHEPVAHLCHRHFSTSTCTSMSQEAPATPSLDKAIKDGQNEVTHPKTLEVFAKRHGDDLGKHHINFRGDIAEKFGYDKIFPISQPKSSGYLVYIQGKSGKTGQEAFYQIMANQWGLLEVLARLD